MIDNNINFESWYKGYYSNLVTTLTAVFNDRTLAEQASAEACVKCYENWGRVSKMSSPEGWTYRVAQN